MSKQRTYWHLADLKRRPTDYDIATFDVGTLFSASVNAHGFGPASVKRAKLANVC